MHASGSTSARLHFRPDASGDGRVEADTWQEDLPPADWDEALRLLKRINLSTAPTGERLASLVTVDGFEPWWFVQDRLFRFTLLPLTRYLPVLARLAGANEAQLIDAPAEARRALRPLSGRAGFPRFTFSDEVSKAASPTRRVAAWFGQAAVRLVSGLALIGFRLTRRDTVLYTIDIVSPGLDHDFRIGPLYAELRRRGYHFAEYTYSLSPRIALGNMLRRRRPAVVLEAFDDDPRITYPLPRAAQPLSAAEGGTLEDRVLRAVAVEVLGWCQASAARYRALRRALMRQGARRGVVFDDNRHNHELVAACHSLGLKVLGFQHGVFNRFHTGTMAYGFEGARSHAFDLYGVWGPLFRERLLAGSRLYEADQVVVCGPLRAPQAAQPEPARNLGQPRVLLVSEPLARKGEVQNYLEALIRSGRFELCVKLRPGEDPAGLRAYGLDPASVRVLQTPTVYEAFSQVDLALGTYSTVLYEAALSLIPTVWLRTAIAYGRELAEEGLAEAAEDPQQVVAAVDRALRLPREELIRRRDRIWSSAADDGARRLVETGEARLWPELAHRGRSR
ncbi:MAG: hypothetical protein NTY23_03655 [Chloroflexi bacterium]|nr:hypothetical protein [Chloroflexota bacterium]